MRIVQLDCRAFGPFTDVQLDFGDGPHGLHVVYGPNEAGKSSALRALWQLLFGIPHHSTDNFLHANPALRIGATLLGSDGDPFQVVRRKGKKNTLRGADDNEPVAPERLSTLLPSIDEAMFRRQFGLDYDELLAGGQAVAAGEGDVGELLFAAGAGLANLGRVQRLLEDEAAEIYAPRATTSRINRAVASLKQARERLQTARLPAAQFLQRSDELCEVRAAVEQLTGELLRLRAKHARLQRIDSAMPVIADRRRWLADWTDLGDARILPADATDRRLSLQQDVILCRQTIERLEQEIAHRELELAELVLHDPLLAAGPEIETLQQELGSHLKAQRDRSTLELERCNHERSAHALLSELTGRATTLAESAGKHLRTVDRVRIQNLSVELSGLESRCEAARSQLAGVQIKQRRAEEELAALGPPVDFAELKRAIRRAQQQCHLEQRLAEGRQQLTRDLASLTTRLKRLPLWSGDVEQLECLPVPPDESIARFETQLATADDLVCRTRERLGELDQQLGEVDQRLAQMNLEQDVPTLADLRQARELRDTAWQRISEVLRGDALLRDDAVSRPAPSRTSSTMVTTTADLARDFEQRMGEADRIADRLRSEAERVTAKAALLVAQQNLTRQREEQRSQAEVAQVQLAERVGQWEALWQPCGITPLPPREMRHWVGRQAELAAAAAQLRLQRLELESLETTVRAECLALVDVVRASDPASLAGLSDRNLGRQLELAQEQLDRLTSSQSQRDQLQLLLRQFDDETPRLESTLQAISAQLQVVRQHWCEAMETLSLPPGASPAEATEVLRVLEEIREHDRAAAGLQERIRGIDADAEHFRADVQRLAERLAPDQRTPERRGAPPTECLAELYQQWKQMRQRQQLRDRAATERDQRSSERDQAIARLTAAEAALAVLVAAAGCENVEQLPTAEHRSARRLELEREKQRLDEQLARLAGNEPSAAFEADAARQDPDRHCGELVDLAAEIQSLDKQRNELATRMGALESELRQLDGGDQAQVVEDEIQNLVAQLQSDVDRYVVVRSAASVLRRAMERFRVKNQGPVLQRASERFMQLTCGSFDGLRVEYGDEDKPFLVGVRSDSRTIVRVNGMSTGTRDQLYLALRLASLEHYLDHHAPLPFVIDDILVQFDNDRAAAALQVLGDVSRRTQVIFFTHHEHLVELARRTLAAEELTVHGLGTAPVT